MKAYCHVILEGTKTSKVCITRTDGKDIKPMTSQTVNGKETVKNGIRTTTSVAGAK